MNVMVDRVFDEWMDVKMNGSVGWLKGVRVDGWLDGCKHGRMI